MMVIDRPREYRAWEIGSEDWLTEVSYNRFLNASAKPTLVDRYGGNDPGLDAEIGYNFSPVQTDRNLGRVGDYVVLFFSDDGVGQWGIYTRNEFKQKFLEAPSVN